MEVISKVRQHIRSKVMQDDKHGNEKNIYTKQSCSLHALSQGRPDERKQRSKVYKNDAPVAFMPVAFMVDRAGRGLYVLMPYNV